MKLTLTTLMSAIAHAALFLALSPTLHAAEQSPMDNYAATMLNESTVNEITVAPHNTILVNTPTNMPYFVSAEAHCDTANRFGVDNANITIIDGEDTVLDHMLCGGV